MDKLKYIESDIPQSEQKHRGWFYKYSEKKYYRWSDFLQEKKLSDKEIAEFLKDYEYRGFEPPPSRSQVRSLTKKTTKSTRNKL